MSIRMILGGGHRDKHHDGDHYTEGYNAGYNNAMDEMRRRTRGYASPLHDEHDMEDRRRTRSEHDVEDRRRTRSEHEHHYPNDDVHWPVEARQIGFTGEPPHHDSHYIPPYDPMNKIMDMLHDVKQGQEHIKKGMASAMKLDPRLEGVLESAVSVMENPPSTWAQYQHRKDFIGIAKMEGKELLAALEARKPMQDIRKELTHTIAALFQLVSMQ